MADYNDPNFLIADADRTPEEQAWLDRRKAANRNALIAVLGLAIIWGITMVSAASRLT